MAHDGQDISQIADVVLPDLMTLTAAAVPAVEALLARAKEVVSDTLTDDGRISATLLEQNQTAAHGLAWLATYVEALRQMQGWAERLQAEGKFGEVEQLIHQIAFGEYLWQIYGGIPMSQGELLRPQDLGLSQDDQRAIMIPAVMRLTQTGNTQAARTRLVELMQERAAEVTVGATGLDDELEMIREQFRRFSVDRVEPHAHEWHLKDELIPMDIIEELSEMGVFGLTIPEEFGGLGLSKASMCVVTEPYTGSDLGSLRTRAGKGDDGDWTINGNKTWITHAARTHVMTVLARTIPDPTDYRGLSMFLAEKTPGTDDAPWQDAGISGGEIEVLGYRGMKEYTVNFDDFKVKGENLLGETEGQGFKQLMQTFESARIQTAARAIGVAQSALEISMQ